MTITGADMMNGVLMLMLAAAVVGIWRINTTLATIQADITYMKETIKAHARRLDVIEHDDARRN